jgi:hypothetical protein
MLAVVSAVVAFDRWPGGAVANPVQTLVLDEKAPAIRVSATASGRSATPSTARSGATAGGRVPHAVLNGGGVAGQRIVGGIRNPADTPAPHQAPAVQPPIKPPVDVPDGDQIFGAISNPDTTAGQIADGAQGVTDAAGVSLGRVSPDVGNTVAATGQAASQAIRDVPLPDHILPGY